MILGVWRLIALGLGTAIVLRYVYWRATSTLPPVNQIEDFIPGVILFIALKDMDYSLARIAHIVESNGVSILSSYIFTRKDTGSIELTLKVNREDLSPVIQSLERHDYEVTSFFQEASHLEDLKGRYDELMRYINI